MKIYSYAENYKESLQFKVMCDEKNIRVYSCDVSAKPINKVWEGQQRPKIQTECSSFVMLGSDGAVTLEIEPDFEYENVIIRPLSKKVSYQRKGSVVEITFDRSGQYSLEFDNIHNSLAVFINPEKSFEEYKNCENVLYFGAGIHIADERIELQDNQTLILDEGAVLYGSVNATDKKNIKIIGYGILDNGRMERANEINGCAVLDPNAGTMTGNPIFLNRCKDVLIEGITIVDSSGWNVYLDGCENILIDNIKLIGQWRYNADGCDFCNCTNGTIQNSFLRTFDDCITVKGFKLNGNLPAQKILVQNCVLWCDWGKALEIGAETCAPYMRDIVFKNCDIIHGCYCMMDIQQGDSADIENITFENINIEYSGDETRPAIESSGDGEIVFWGDSDKAIPFGIVSGVTMWSIDSAPGNMKNITLKDICITSVDNVFPIGSKIVLENEFSKIEGVFIDNVYFNGRKCDMQEMGLNISKNVKAVFWNGVKVV